MKTELIGKIYEAIDDDAVLAELPSLIAKEIGSRSCSIQFFDREFELEGMWLNHFSDEMGEFYAENRLQHHDAWTNINMNVFGVNNTQRHTDYLPVKEFCESFFYNEFIRRFGDDSAYCLGFAATRQDGGYVVVGLQKARSDTDFTAKQVRQHDLLRPHLTRMAEIRRNLRRRERMAACALLGIDAIKNALLIITATRKVVFANLAAEQLLSDGALICVRGGQAYLVNQTGDKRLSRALRDAGNREIVGETAFSTRCRDGATWRFTITPRRMGEATAYLLWIDRDTIDPAAPHRIGQIYGLTATEIRVLNLLSSGKKAATIAAELSVSVPTVRSHVQSIHRKTGARKSAEIARMVSSLPKVK